jgi:phosphotriesterase-related protein
MKELKGKIQTVLGLIEPDELGFTQTHEHLIVNLIPEALREYYKGEPITLENVGYFKRNWLSNPYNMVLDSETDAINELKRFKSSGGSAIVEVSPIAAGRDPEAFARISRATGVHVIMGTSYYNAAFHPPDIAKLSENDIAEIFLNEIFRGANATGIKAGIIGEIALDWPAYESEMRVLRAGAIAQKQSGASLNIHPGRSHESPLDAIRIVKQAGGKPERTVISHVERTLMNLDDMLRLADTGCYLEFDLFGQEASYYPLSDIDMPNDAMRIDYIIELIKRGFGDKILVSLDVCHKTQLSKYGGDGYNHILDNVLPIMRRKGMNGADIDAITVGNPAKMLAFA